MKQALSSSSVAEMGECLATIDMGQKLGGCDRFLGDEELGAI